MNIFKGISVALIFMSFGYSSMIYANDDSSQTMSVISDDQLRDIDAQSNGGRIQGLEQIQLLILNSGLQISNLNHRDAELNTLNNTYQKHDVDSIQQMGGAEHSNIWMQQVLHNVFSNVQAFNPKITINDNRLLIQLKSIHIERIEVDMNMNGLMHLIDPIGVTNAFVASNISR